MAIFINAAAILSTPHFPKFNRAESKPLKARAAVCSLGKNGGCNGFHHMELEGPDNSEMYQEMLQSMSSSPEKKHNDIWRLFKEARQNILYLNKQRMVALEELDKMKRETKFLHDRVEQLELEKQPIFGKDKLSVSSELLLRIDSMILTGMIGTGEASDLRRMIMDSKVSLADDFSDILHKRDAELLGELRHFSEKSKKKGFHIVHICTEMAPVISVGSLALYVTEISRALQRKGHLVEVVLPKYASLNQDEVQVLREIDAEFYSYFNGQLHKNRIWTGVVYGIGITFIEPIYYSSFFSHDRIYGHSNDFERFSYFSRASLDYIVKSGKQPDVLHIHNWQTAIVGPLFWDIFVKQGLGATRILLTCHDLDYQCLDQPDKLALCGLDPSRLHRPDRLQDNTKSHLVNILKGGIVYSNKVIIMSSVHSKGVIIHSLNHGLEPTLAIHKDKLLVAPYGFDNSAWNPSMDHFLPQSYSADDMKGKAVCKVALQRHFGLSENASIVLVGCIFSVVSDVDLEKLKELAWFASRKDVQFIFMGMSKISGINKSLESFREELKDDNLKAIRNGAAPVTATFVDNQFRQIIGHDLESTNLSQYISNTFGNLSLNQAIDEIKNNPSQWNRKIKDAMAKDFSWDAECCDIHVAAYTSIKNL